VRRREFIAALLALPWWERVPGVRERVEYWRGGKDGQRRQHDLA
jgi:hypothetical protein